MSVFPVTRLHYVASDGCALLLRDEIDAMDADAFALYLKYHFATCERADLAGITSPVSYTHLCVPCPSFSLLFIQISKRDDIAHFHDAVAHPQLRAALKQITAAACLLYTSHSRGRGHRPGRAAEGHQRLCHDDRKPFAGLSSVCHQPAEPHQDERGPHRKGKISFFIIA